MRFGFTHFTFALGFGTEKDLLPACYDLMALQAAGFMLGQAVIISEFGQRCFLPLGAGVHPPVRFLKPSNSRVLHGRRRRIPVLR